MALSEKIVEQLDEAKNRHAEVEMLLSDPETMADQARFRELSREYADIQPIVEAYDRLRSIDQELDETTELLNSEDSELRALARDAVEELRPVLQEATSEVERLLLPVDPNDHANVYLEIRAGTGGEEAALFVGDLVKMYEKYADLKGWEHQIINKRLASQGGLKEAIFRIAGRDVFSRLKFESGAHRVQRIPQTESQGRIHTSACTVAILPEIEEITDFEIHDSDLRIDTYRASGAGGQHVNKTDSAVRITHLPSGTVAECQDERSQHLNKERAFSLLKSKLVESQRAAQKEARTNDRKNQVGSGDRSEKVRTYNFPQGRLTDHRVNLTLYKLDEILEGSLDQVIDPLIQDHQAKQLREFRDGSQAHRDASI